MVGSTDVFAQDGSIYVQGSEVMKKLREFAALHELLKDLEADLGFADLSQPQKAILCAVELLSERGTEVPLRDIQKHRLTSALSRPTLFRALKYLLDNEYLVVNYYKGRSTYFINK